MTDTAYDVVVIGAGIVGLAAARTIKMRHPQLSVAVVDKEPDVGVHQTGHNSGVLHSGIYYKPGSLKARLCVRGKALVEQYAAERGIPFEHNGKLVIAVDEVDIARLDELERRGNANGVAGLERIPGEAIAEFEPSATGIAALRSPATGVIDYSLVARSVAGDLTSSGVDLRLGTEVTSVREDDNGRVLVHTDGATLAARCVLACGGLHADRLAQSSGLQIDPKIVPFKGLYFRLADDSDIEVRGNIYPVPDPRFPFLGVHLTRRIDGSVVVGPTAMLAAGREAYPGGRKSMSDVIDALGFSGLRRFLVRSPVSALRELAYNIKPIYARAARRLVPEIRSSDLMSGMAGIRAQLMAPDGALVDDFAFAESARVVHVLNAPSPAATASFAIGEVLADKVEERLKR
ncbi:MAG: L-2-hydroxyglutarate oxidase [Acidimicrobiia bacterium]|nr:L-2-hydroxyglutarate oxidase [Acidimicrobiia bacterium]